MNTFFIAVQRLAEAGFAALYSARVPADRRGRDRGDVPGWVMITMMTAIVVIVLLGVFQDAVVTAVRNAFDSISGAGSSGQSTP